jgi:glycosyltransferase involved in cell wall biosynthesis
MISVVILTLNEAPALPGLLTAQQNERAKHETIVVDGGSRDATVAIARARGARVIQAPSGRGNQLGAGVQQAAGDISAGGSLGSMPGSGGSASITAIPGFSSGAARMKPSAGSTRSRLWKISISCAAWSGSGRPAAFASRR